MDSSSVAWVQLNSLSIQKITHSWEIHSTSALNQITTLHQVSQCGIILRTVDILL